MKKLTAVVVGYGGRGAAYARYSLNQPEELEIVGVAEPNAARLASAAQWHNIPRENCYSSWRDLANQPKMADFAILTTQDNMHYEPALALIDKGYHLLLEKPMAPTPQECKAITEAAERKGVKVVVCHVLRFTPFWCTIKDLVDKGRLGQVMSIMGAENVGHIHQSHSYVRGPWRNTAESSCMIMAKCCHDMDILQWILGEKCISVQSFGSLRHFTKENQPAGAPDRCTDGCPHSETCHYYAPKLYTEPSSELWGWGRKAAAGTVDAPTDEQVWDALLNGPYGRCVYACDNDVVDHQVVNLEYESGCTASFTMSAFNKGGRFIRIFGTEGELISDLNKRFPHWFCDNYNKYSDKEQDLFIDHHGLIALIAPRPVYVASATLDDWADPEGEYLSAKYASPVWELYGKRGLKSQAWPMPEEPDNSGYVAYHLRTGKHDITSYDWAQYIKFANQHFKK